MPKNGSEIPFPISGNEAPKSVDGFTAIRFINDPGSVYIQAAGMNPKPGYRTFFYIGPEAVYPPRLHFANIPPNGYRAEVMTPYYASFALKLPPDGIQLPGLPHSGPIRSITIYTANGAVEIPIANEVPPPEFVAQGGGEVPSPF